MNLKNAIRLADQLQRVESGRAPELELAIVLRAEARRSERDLARAERDKLARLLQNWRERRDYWLASDASERTGVLARLEERIALSTAAFQAASERYSLLSRSASSMDAEERGLAKDRWRRDNPALPPASVSGRQVGVSAFDRGRELRHADYVVCPACGKLVSKELGGKESQLCGCDSGMARTGKVRHRDRARLVEVWVRPALSERLAFSRRVSDAAQLVRTTGDSVRYETHVDPTTGVWAGITAAVGVGLEPVLGVPDSVCGTRALRTDDAAALREGHRQELASRVAAREARVEYLDAVNDRCAVLQRREGRTAPRGHRGGRRGRKA